MGKKLQLQLHRECSACKVLLYLNASAHMLWMESSTLLWYMCPLDNANAQEFFVFWIRVLGWVNSCCKILMQLGFVFSEQLVRT